MKEFWKPLVPGAGGISLVEFIHHSPVLTVLLTDTVTPLDTIEQLVKIAVQLAIGATTIFTLYKQVRAYRLKQQSETNETKE